MIPKKQAATSCGEYLLQLTFACLLELLAFRVEVSFARSTAGILFTSGESVHLSCACLSRFLTFQLQVTAGLATA